MAAGPSIDVPGWLEEQLALASPAVAYGIAASRWTSVGFLLQARRELKAEFGIVTADTRT